MSTVAYSRSGQDKVDHNCNGIFGTTPQGSSFEDALCKDSQSKGVAVLGDSAAGTSGQRFPLFFSLPLFLLRPLTPVAWRIVDGSSLPHSWGVDHCCGHEAKHL